MINANRTYENLFSKIGYRIIDPAKIKELNFFISSCKCLMGYDYKFMSF